MELHPGWSSTRAFLGTTSVSAFFINDIVTDIGSYIRHLADNTSLFIIAENPDMAA